jgi:hypothetical protein
MKKCSNSHTSFVLSEEISKNRKVQVATSVLLLAVLGLQLYTLYGTIELFQAAMF